MTDLSFITREGMQYRQIMRNLEQGARSVVAGDG